MLLLSHAIRIEVSYTVQISRQLRDLARNSPTLQHQRNLFSAGLIENPCIPCDFAQRRKLCEEYTRKWSSEGRATKTTHEVPEGLSHSTPTPYGNLIVSRSMRDNGLDFLRISPGASKEPIKCWCIPPLPFDIEAFTVYPPENILAVVGESQG